ncbi:MAG: tRNA1(Val) (adenine(37)-N6)-methyltransferase [Treponema sp.]|nr:tRNA1(Val) (adenine(37)-N6)-methyltransferase [Treponema sp.]
MEQIDTLSNNNKIIQDPDSFMFGIDAVLLAHFACGGVRAGCNVFDLGTGNGIIPLLMEKACKAASFTGLEIQKKSVDLARRSVTLNGLENKIQIVQGDIKNIATLFSKHTFNVVTSNPPYMPFDKKQAQNDSEEKAIARHEIMCTLDDVVSAAEFLLHSHGRFFMIHRPERLSEIFVALAKYKLEPKRMRLVQPFENEAPNLVLIEARKDARPGLKLEPALIVREKAGKNKGEYTQEVQRIYKDISGSISDTSR